MNARFLAGTDHAEAFANVCVERKPMEPSILLQAEYGERSAATSKWEQVHDMMCDGVQDWHSNLVAAKVACIRRQDCAGVMDHSSTQGRFGLCTSTMPFR